MFSFVCDDCILLDIALSLLGFIHFMGTFYVNCKIENHTSRSFGRCLVQHKGTPKHLASQV